MLGVDETPATTPGAAPTPKRRGAPTPKRRSRHDTPERRKQPGVAPASQHFDIGASLPPHLQPTGFIDLEDKRDAILSYLRSVEGMTQLDAKMFLQNLEADMMSAVGH